LVCHIVCVTKYRRKTLDAATLEELRTHAKQMFDTMGCELLACDGEADHFHLLVEYPPKLSVSKLVNAFKGTSSRMLRKRFGEMARRTEETAFWSPSYFAASAGGAPLEKLKTYVEDQRASSSP
jgi:putative transposase